jgi:hypothetical protein
VQTWINQVGALLHASYPGQNGGQALAEILFGRVNPSGKLPFTWEKLIKDTPAVATFPMPLNQKPLIPLRSSIQRGYLSATVATKESYLTCVRIASAVATFSPRWVPLLRRLRR